MVRCFFVFVLVSTLALPTYGASNRSLVLMGKELSLQSVQRGAVGLFFSACLGLAGCAWQLPTPSPASSNNDTTERVLVYADETSGHPSNTHNRHRDTHTVRLNTIWGDSSAEARAESRSNYVDGYYLGWTNVSSHGHIMLNGGIEWHGHKHASQWLTALNDGDLIYGIRHWNSTPYFDSRDELAGDALSSVLFTYVVDGVVLVGIGIGAPYKSACPDFLRDQTLTHVQRLGTLTIGAPQRGWYEKIAVADVSGVLFTHHPDYELDRQVSFVEQSMQYLVQDWLALQDEATRQAFQQAEGEITFTGERLGIFTDGERLIEVTEMEFANGERHKLQNFPSLVHGANILTN